MFAFVTAEKAPLYRSIMHVFMEANAVFTFHLRPRQILERITAAGFPATVDQEEIDSALSQLTEWGNLEAFPDTADVTTVEDFTFSSSPARVRLYSVHSTLLKPGRIPLLNCAGAISPRSGTFSGN